MFAGTKEHPISTGYGQIQAIVKRGPPAKLGAPVKADVTLSNVYYRAEAGTGGLFKLTSGGVGGLVIGAFRVSLASNDIRNGVLQTNDFGPVDVFVIPNMGGADTWVLAVTDDQLKRIRDKAQIPLAADAKGRPAA
ncbi:MAG TPA: hypothetical protein VHV77_06460, partial [Pirellulales bacterium]|nr:hypothetical protein [Pirellulales bacterium]